MELPNITIRKHENLPLAFLQLIHSSQLEGHTFIERTQTEWNQKKNCFDRRGECFLLAWQDEIVVACCGLNLDPYLDDSQIGRVRHLYVLPDFRRCGIARLLIKEIIREAQKTFSYLRLRANTHSPESFLFYDALGFERVEDPTGTHLLKLESLDDF